MGDLLDVFILACVLVYGFSGYRQGLVVGSLSLVGFVGGGLLGAQLATPLSVSLGIANSGKAPGFGIAALVLGAVFGQLVAATLGVWLRRRITWQPLRLIDGISGATIAAVSVLLVAWALAQVAVRARDGAISSSIRHSVVLKAVDAILPDSARSVLAAILRLVDDTGFPRIFNGFGAEQIVPVAPPDPALLHQPGVLQSYPAIVKVTGQAPACQRRSEGSGFVFAHERVMTNAHVVAGVRQLSVLTPDGQVHPATVVLYDPRRDVAVLRVVGLRTTPLSFAGPVDRGASAVVAGYPQDGPFDARPARVRSRQKITGPDIYQSRTVTREAYVLYARVRPGNSGGPLLAPDGSVDGVVFAASTDDSTTGYALTAAEVASDARSGVTAAGAVSTQGCD